MKGEIFRRMSMEINNDEGIERVNNSVKKDVERDKENDDDDYLMKTIGAFGLWQALVSIALVLTRALAFWNMMSLSFLTPIVEYVCVEFSDNVTIQVKNSTCYVNCLKYEYSSAMGRSIIEDFGLICEKAWLASFTQSILMFGLVFGVGFFGWLSDRFGRRAALLQSTFLNAVFMIALPFSPSYVIFTSIRFVIGIASGGSLIIGVVEILEIIGKRHREIAGACSLIPDGLAVASLAGFAYFTSNWQGYTLSYGVATCLIFVMILFVPESPRWLVSNGKVDEAVKVITRAAIRNKLDTSTIKAEITKVVEDIKLKVPDNVKTTYLDFFKTKSIFIMTLSIFVMWFALGVCYFGIYEYVTIIGFDPYLSVVIMGLMQALFCPLGIILNKMFGRKISTIGLAFVTTIVMLILIFVPKGHWLTTILGVMGLICSNICFGISYTYVSELYPTPLRNMAFGLSSAGAKIGAMVAPFIAVLSPRWLPSVIFCIFAILIGLCCSTLHETKGQNLEDTVKK